jgi:transcriptional regulator with XRE-family HTH domain
MSRPIDIFYIPMRKIHEQIKRLRQRRCLTQVELGQLIGVSQQVITNCERSLREPYVETLVKIAASLKVTMDQLAGTKPVEAGKDPMPRSLTKRLEKVKSLPKEEQKAFISMVDAFTI